MSIINEEIKSRLYEMQDIKYRSFNSSLIPSVDKERFIGVRTPQLRKLSAELAGREDIVDFLYSLPHEYFEENLLHGFIIERIGKYSESLARIEEFLPYIDNWAVCDQCSPKVFGKHKPELLSKIYEWTASGKTYTVRYGIGMLMRYYLDDDFSLDYPGVVAGVSSEDYYVNMMRAWYFATALSKQYEAVIGYFKDNLLDKWTHNKAIQKACESYRVAPEQKAYLRTLRRKD